ncbi:uncharacterized protein LOC134829092 [Culicoides brevitarsis]|uniref:uncharacterized protein LOC134829092 n=1 Tax=Culicoides brevitarsis TaxID=469753 RepID=UPI00307B18BC
MHLLPVYLVLCFFGSSFVESQLLAPTNQWSQRRSFRPGLFRACDLPKIKNGVVRLRQRGRLAMFNCRSPYILHGDRYSSCISGRWDVPPPICIKSGCTVLPTPNNSVVYPQHENAILTMFCHSGYQRVGSAQAYCDGENWDRPLGVCREISTSVQTSCDFEIDDLCGWTQDANHDFDWKRTNGVFFGKVLSIGPKHDHTIGRPLEGYYMYLDMKDEDVGTKARLVSPTFNATQSENACFRLFYHMFGLSPGKLRVYAKPLSTEIMDAVTNDGYKFFETQGNQGNLWKEGFFQLPVFKEEFQIIIEGTSTRSYDSHIAIDDLSLMNGTDCDRNEATNNDDPEEEDGIFGTQSCENRCSEEETTLLGDSTDILTFSNGTKVKKCDCFYGCEDIKTCCQNYRAICAQATTPEEAVSPTEVAVKTTTTTKRTTTSTTTRSTTTSTTTPKTTTVKTTPKTTPTTKKSTTRSTTTTSSTTTTTPKTTKTTQKTTKMTTSTSKVTTPAKIVDDVVPLETTTYEDDYSGEDFVPLPPGKHHQEVTFPDSSKDTNFIFSTIITGILIFIALIGIAAGTFYYRRQKYDPRNYKQNNGGSGGEMHAGDEFSEVRFLTNDEQLDFALQTPSTSTK